MLGVTSDAQQRIGEAGQQLLRALPYQRALVLDHLDKVAHFRHVVQLEMKERPADAAQLWAPEHQPLPEACQGLQSLSKNQPDKLPIAHLEALIQFHR